MRFNQGGWKAGHCEVNGETLLRHVHAADQSGCHHPPANRALQRAKSEDQPQPPSQLPFNPATKREEQQRQQKGSTDQAAEQPVCPFPPVNALEFIKGRRIRYRSSGTRC
jgi:hypothetical protein